MVSQQELMTNFHWFPHRFNVRKALVKSCEERHRDRQTPLLPLLVLTVQVQIVIDRFCSRSATNSIKSGVRFGDYTWVRESPADCRSVACYWSRVTNHQS